MKKIVLLFSVIFIILSCSEKPVTPKKSTQAYLGLKEGGEWVWVTKSSGKEQFEYQGGEFKSVTDLKVAKQHTDHSFDIQFEGPGWESEKIGYRLYLDWRNAIDIFGKTTDSLVLHKVGLDGFDSYHEMQDWGVDVLNVGSSLGIGSLGFWDGKNAIRVEKTDSIFCSVESGKKESKVNVDYYGWEIDNQKTNVFSTLQIEPGSALTKYEIQLSEDLPNLVTGIVKLPETQLLDFDDLKPGWGCLATFGKQTLQDNFLGMCIFYRKNQMIETMEDEFSYVVVLTPENKKLTYYFGAAWEFDESKVKSVDNFEEFLKSQVKYLN